MYVSMVSNQLDYLSTLVEFCGNFIFPVVQNLNFFNCESVFDRPFWASETWTYITIILLKWFCDSLLLKQTGKIDEITKNYLFVGIDFSMIGI